MSTRLIRPLRRHDASACAALHATAFHRGWEAAEIVSLIGDPTILAEGAFAPRGDRLLGFILSRQAADEAEILTLVVDKKARRSGIARQILGLHRQCLVDWGVANLYLEVGEDNAAALRLYEELGFVRVGERKAYYPTASGVRVRAFLYVWRTT